MSPLCLAYITPLSRLYLPFLPQVLPVALVGLVMLILTIKYRRAGPSLELHAAIFEETTQLVHNAEPSSPLLRHMDMTAMDAEAFHVGLADSHEVSKYMLDTYNDHTRPQRFGALVVNDTLHVHLFANWSRSRLDAAEGGRLLEPLREVAAGALLSCGGALLPRAGVQLQQLNVPLDQLNRTEVVGALQAANTTELLMQGGALLRPALQQVVSVASQAGSGETPPATANATSSLLDLLDGALGVGGTTAGGTSLSAVVLRTALAENLDDRIDDLIAAIEGLPEQLSVQNVVANLAPDQLGDAILEEARVGEVQALVDTQRQHAG